MSKWKDPQRWFWGIVSAVAGAFWGAMETCLALPAVDSEIFNYGPGLHKTLKAILIFSALSAFKVAVTTLKQSPVPPRIEDDEPPAKQLTRSDIGLDQPNTKPKE
jgi:hypothetical protein